MTKVNYKKILQMSTGIVFLLMFLWTLYSPALWGARQESDFGMTVYVFFLITFLLLGVNYLVKGWKKK